MAGSQRNEPPVSALRLTVSLLFAGLVCGAVIGFAYVSLLLVAPLAGVGIPATAFLAAAFLIRTEQATVFLVTRWRPTALVLVLAALPAAGLAFALRGLFGWHGLLGIVLAVGAGLITQAVSLSYLIAAAARRATASVPDLGPQCEQGPPTVPTTNSGVFSSHRST